MFTYGKNMYIWQRKSLMQWVIICKLFFGVFFYIFGLLWKTYDAGNSNQCNDANVNMVVNFAITMSKKFEISVLASTYLKKSEKNV